MIRVGEGRDFKEIEDWVYSEEDNGFVNDLSTVHRGLSDLDECGEIEDRYHSLVYETADNKIIGYLIYRGLQGGLAMHLDICNIREEYKGNGYGTELYNYFKKMLLSNKNTFKISLEAVNGSETFWSKHGFNSESIYYLDNWESNCMVNYIKPEAISVKKLEVGKSYRIEDDDNIVCEVEIIENKYITDNEAMYHIKILNSCDNAYSLMGCDAYRFKKIFEYYIREI